MKIGVVQFPGTNCELDVLHAVEALGAEAELLFHADATVRGVDAVVVPGGFAHGDYLRAGAIARFSPVMDAVAAHARAGGPVVGICNGFQVLTEAGLLPGALQKNAGLKFLCRPVDLRVETVTTVLTNQATVGQILRIPVNHFEGNYVCDDRTLDALRAEERVVVRYVENPNGALDDIAGICNEGRNVVGLMPHPERASDALLGSTDGLVMLRSLLARGPGRPRGVTLRPAQEALAPRACASTRSAKASSRSRRAAPRAGTSTAGRSASAATASRSSGPRSSTR